MLHRVSSLSNCMLFASPSKFSLRQFFIFLTSEAHFSALQSVFQVSSHSVFVVRTRNCLFAILWERAWTLLICRFSGVIIRRPERSEKDCNLCRRDEHIRRNPSQNTAFFTKSEHTIKQAVALSSPVSTVFARNAWVFTSLLPSFSQHQSKNAW